MKKILEEAENKFIKKLKSMCKDEIEFEFYLYAHRNPGRGCMNHQECYEHFRAGYELAEKKFKKDG